MTARLIAFLASGWGIVAVIVLSAAGFATIGTEATTLVLSVAALSFTQAVLIKQEAAAECDREYRQRVDHELLRAVPEADETVAEGKAG